MLESKLFINLKFIHKKLNSALIVRPLLIVFFCLITSGCQLIPYSKKEVDLSKINDHINVQTPSAESFQDFLSSIKEVNFEPIDKGWNIDSLLAALYFFNTQIKIARSKVSFDIDIPYDILSNGKIHSVALKEIKLPAAFNYYAAPKLDKEAFLMAEISDYSKYNLLPGEANIIFEGMYVGKTMINPNQTSETFNLSLGRDKKINIKREKVVDKSGTKFLSAYKEQTFTYDITLRNNKKEEVTLMLKDQFPLSSDKEITIELLDDGKATVNPESGIMTWDLKLASNETKKIRISYKVKYPKDQVIGNL